LLRDYGFDLEDLPFEISGSLPAHLDPKTAWAQVHLSNSPVEINRASCSELLRVPGIGPKGANAILAARRSGKIADLEGLSKIGVNPVRARPYILLNGKRPDQQLSFMF
jgi:predicted DNA-binding helix-hairpin-helix protein